FGKEETSSFLNFLQENSLVPETILLTHAHLDHILGVQKLCEIFGCRVYMNPADAPVLTFDEFMAKKLGMGEFKAAFTYLPAEDGDTIDTAGISLKVIGTPGHTPGCVCYYAEKEGMLFSGDTLFRGTIGRTDLEYGNYDDEIRSVMDKLMGLPSEVEVYPGHGAPTTIGAERYGNPFLEPWGDAEEDTQSL
ncbi:MAG: MBL fold metallo-hydrolase, partial [Bacteroidales bacterium]|nr:MBL fold metallo-hydrolase [Bacteroidales bacterium]